MLMTFSLRGEREKKRKLHLIFFCVLPSERFYNAKIGTQGEGGFVEMIIASHIVCLNNLLFLPPSAQRRMVDGDDTNDEKVNDAKADGTGKRPNKR